MTTQPVGTRRPASLPGGVIGYAGQSVKWSSSRTSMIPFAIHAALTTVVSGPGTDMAGQRDDVVLGSAFTSLPPGTAADSRSPGGTRRAGRVSYEL